MFIIFDNTKWDNPQVEAEIFTSILNSTKENSSLNQAGKACSYFSLNLEIFIVERVVDYLIGSKNSSKLNQESSYKNNKELEVKIKVLNLLEVILDQINKPFLSFLLIDNVLTCFLINIEDPNYCSKHDCRLKEAIFKTHKKFLEKIGTSSKNKSQVINTIITDIAFRASNKTQFLIRAKEYFNLLSVTLDNLGVFPSKLTYLFL